MLDTARLTVFAQVAANGSIAQAARDLGYTPSAVSQQLAKLEREIGAALVTRTRRGVELTAAGHALADSIAGLLHQLAAAEQAVRDVTRARANELRLGSFASGSLTLLAPAIARFREEHPAVRLSLSEIEPPGGFNALRSGRLDILITHVYPNLTPPAPGTLIREELLQDPLVAVFPPSRAPRAAAGPVLAEHLAGIPLISGGTSDANRIALEAMFASSSVAPNVDFETKDYAVTLALVAAGAGTAIVPDSVVRRMAPDLPALAIKPCQTRRIFALRRPTAREPVVTFMAYLRETVMDPARER
jgi:DNA-binding transcriptional LysR family regulator